jgi:predicted helicase
MDGTMTAPERDQILAWLKENTPNNECRIITNVRVLSEGVDVPSLDSVLFLSARNSQIDVVQSVGRVMRISPGKKYGYIIIPVVVPADVEADKALDDNERYRVVWTVLNALRAHDDRFNATVNKIELNRKRPDNILVGRPEYSFDEDGNPWLFGEDSADYEAGKNIARQLALQFEQLQSVVFGRIVQKVGERTYWEQWARDVAYLAERQIERITYLIENKRDQREAFDRFLTGLQKNINPSITEEKTVEMLAQHIITEPIFEALFEGYSFEQNNPVSKSMETVLAELEGKSVAEESETLQKFYQSVRKRAEGIDNAEAKQRIIIELYDTFFKTAFPKMVEQLGIVYTPVEVVDFIINSVDAVLRQEFGRSIADENVHILDPFTGTGTFITRLLQSGLIGKRDLKRKYRHELHANEIVLLAYYIAAVNIENVYYDLMGGEGEYEPFEGIVLTDTFQLGESDEKLFSEVLAQNSERVERQKKAPLMVIMGNPPYSIGQRSANDNAQNQSYEKLDDRISQTYAAKSSASLSRALYDPYIKAFRWSTDRLDAEHGGVVAFVSNGAWLDANSTDGFRKTIEKEFSSIWVFNLRGNQRTSGELSRKEGGKIFGSGSRTPIAITLLVKNPQAKVGKATIHYHDIGDYLSQKEKLGIIKQFGSVANPEMKWDVIEPNEHGDWLNKRSDVFQTLIPMAPKKRFDARGQSFFVVNGPGIATNRDAWVYNFNRHKVESNMKRMIKFYNAELSKLTGMGRIESDGVTNAINTDPTQISWTANLRRDFKSRKRHSFVHASIAQALYRPFCKSYYYSDRALIERPGLSRAFFPQSSQENIAICVSGLGGNKDHSAIVSNIVTDLNCLEAGTQYFPLYYYDEPEQQNLSLFDDPESKDFIRRDGVSDFILKRAQEEYGNNVGKEDIFYYVYGILHSPDYRTTFANDLKKILPRIPLVEDRRDFWKFSRAGRKLADLHINYEDVPPYEGVKIVGADKGHYEVERMRFAKVRTDVDGKRCLVNNKTTIHFNSAITVSNIPGKAYEYIVNGRSAIEWIMERYRVSTHKGSGITNDPNDWAKEVGNPRYILDLLLSVINVSMQTIEIVEKLPALDL